MKTLVILLIFISYTYADIDGGTLTGLQILDHWNTFRIVLSNTEEECFYLETKLDDRIHVIYQIIKGGDSFLQVIITNPLNNVTFIRTDHSFGWYKEEDSKTPGTYKICLKNQRYFSTKIVYIGVLAAHINHLMESAVKNIQEERNSENAIIETFSTKAMKSFSIISGTLYQLTAYHTVARVRHAHDYYAAIANEKYVQKWAIYQIITMIICSIIQVFCIRRLFKSTISKKTKSSNKNFLSPSSSDFYITTN